MKKILIAFLFILSACSSPSANDDNDLSVSVSISPLAGIVKEIAPELEVYTAIPKGYSPASYDPSISEIETLSNSKLFFKIGVPAEANILDNIDNENMKVVDLQATVNSQMDPIYIGESVNPHIWMSLDRIAIIAKTMYDNLVELDPDNEESYKTNLDAYLDKVSDLEAYANEKMPTGKDVIIYHPSLDYFFQKYDIRVYAVEDGGKEATAKRLVELSDIVKEKNIKVMFYQDEISSKQVESFATSNNLTLLKVDPLNEDVLASIKNIIDMCQEEL